VTPTQEEIQSRLMAISRMMGAYYPRINMKTQIKFRKLMDPFLDELVEMTDPRTIDLLVVKEWKKNHGR